MKSSLRFTLAAILVACVAWTTAAMGATEAQKLAAIQKALNNLYTTQTGGGYWNYGGYEQAATGAAVFSFLSQSDKWGANSANYQAAMSNAMNYLLTSATTTPVSTRNDGVNICPGGGGSCTAISWYGGGETTYTTGLVAPAIADYAAKFGGGASAVATTSGPLAGMTWAQIAQGITNTFAAGQTARSDALSYLNGGWRYWPAEQDSDMSTTQWAVISMIYDQTLGAQTPTAIKTSLANWLAYAQDPVGGGGCYQGPNSGLCDNSDTGGLLLGLYFLGKNTSDPAVQAALKFLNNNWNTYANSWYGNFGQPYAMWADYKGLQTTIGLQNNTYITNLLTTCGAPNNLPLSGICNWWEDYNEWLVENQNADGSWSGYAYWNGPLATAFDVNILGATEIPSSTPEPGTLLLLGSGVVGLAGVVRRKLS